jgi:hypothetical protein
MLNPTASNERREYTFPTSNESNVPKDLLAWDLVVSTEVRSTRIRLRMNEIVQNLICLKRRAPSLA